MAAALQLLQARVFRFTRTSTSTTALPQRSTPDSSTPTRSVQELEDQEDHDATPPPSLDNRFLFLNLHAPAGHPPLRARMQLLRPTPRAQRGHLLPLRGRHQPQRHHDAGRAHARATHESYLRLLPPALQAAGGVAQPQLYAAAHRVRATVLCFCRLFCLRLMLVA